MRLQLVAAFATVLAARPAATVAQSTAPPTEAAIVELARAARDADLRGDWPAMIRVHGALEAVRPGPRQRVWVDYYLGYLDWRRASLAYLGEGPLGSMALLRQAAAHLDRALAAAPDLTEARILLALIDAYSMGANPGRAAELGAKVAANVRQASSEAPGNPRVRLIRAMLSFFSPQSGPAAKDSALVAWREAAETFGRPVAGAPEWGDAESWGWLGAALLFAGRAELAREALDRAVTLRPDFWWARDVAMPQAVHSRLGEDRALLDAGSGP